MVCTVVAQNTVLGNLYPLIFQTITTEVALSREEMGINNNN